MIQVRLFGVENKTFFLNYSYTHLVIDTSKINIFLFQDLFYVLLMFSIFSISVTLF